MGLKRPPQHRVDAGHTFILVDDDAWDVDKIDAEKKAMKEAGDDPGTHPVEAYRECEGRFDLGAKTPVLGEERAAMDYLRAGVAPWKFDLVPLKSQNLCAVQDLIAATRNTEAWRLACLKGVRACDGFDIKPRGGGKHARISEAGVEALCEEFGIGVLIELGAAVYNVSQPPTVAEKKP